MKNLRTIMIRAWELAREGVAKFGGAARQYLRASLQIAWREAKAPSQKEIAQDLDVAARRAGDRAATKKQVRYLAGLLARRGVGANWIGCARTCTQAALTGKLASHYINDSLAAIERMGA